LTLPEIALRTEQARGWAIYVGAPYESSSRSSSRRPAKTSPLDREGLFGALTSVNITIAVKYQEEIGHNLTASRYRLAWYFPLCERAGSALFDDGGDSGFRGFRGFVD
jgi:hypothetical protein